MSIGMTSSSTKVRFGRIAATVPVSCMERALSFYTRILGFEVVFENGTPVGFVILKRESGEIHLSLDRKHTASTNNVAHVLVDDAESLYIHCQQHGVRIVKSLRDADHGLRCFVFSDPDGNRIDVGQVLAES